MERFFTQRHPEYDIDTTPITESLNDLVIEAMRTERLEYELTILREIFGLDCNLAGLKRLLPLVTSIYNKAYEDCLTLVDKEVALDTEIIKYENKLTELKDILNAKN